MTLRRPGHSGITPTDERVIAGTSALLRMKKSEHRQCSSRCCDEAWVASLTGTILEYGTPVMEDNLFEAFVTGERDIETWYQSVKKEQERRKAQVL